MKRRSEGFWEISAEGGITSGTIILKLSAEEDKKLPLGNFLLVNELALCSLPNEVRKFK